MFHVKRRLMACRFRLPWESFLSITIAAHGITGASAAVTSLWTAIEHLQRSPTRPVWYSKVGRWVSSSVAPRSCLTDDGGIPSVSPGKVAPWPRFAGQKRGPRVRSWNGPVAGHYLSDAFRRAPLASSALANSVRSAGTSVDWRRCTWLWVVSSRERMQTHWSFSTGQTNGVVLKGSHCEAQQWNTLSPR